MTTRKPSLLQILMIGILTKKLGPKVVSCFVDSHGMPYALHVRGRLMWNMKGSCHSSSARSQRKDAIPYPQKFDLGLNDRIEALSSRRNTTSVQQFPKWNCRWPALV